MVVVVPLLLVVVVMMVVGIVVVVVVLQIATQRIIVHASSQRNLNPNGKKNKWQWQRRQN
jgi:hypothetical protein